MAGALLLKSQGTAVPVSTFTRPSKSQTSPLVYSKY